MVERKFNRDLEARSGGGVLEGIRRLPKSIKSIIAGIAASAAFTVSEGTANAAMTAADQVTEYSDLTKVRTENSNPYSLSSLTLNSGLVLSVSSSVSTSDGGVLSKGTLDSQFYSSRILDSQNFVFVVHETALSGESRVLVYDKSSLLSGPIHTISDNERAFISSVIGEVSLNGRDFIVMKNHNLNKPYIIYSPASGPAPAISMTIDSSHPFYNNVVLPVVNGLSAHGVIVGDIEAAKNDVSGKQTLVVKNSQGTFDIYEQTYDQGASTVEEKPDPVITGLDGTTETITVGEDMMIDFPVTSFVNVTAVKIVIEGTTYDMVQSGNEYVFDASVLGLSAGKYQVQVIAEGQVENGALETDISTITLDINEKQIQPGKPLLNVNNLRFAVGGKNYGSRIDFSFAQVDEKADNVVLDFGNGYVESASIKNGMWVADLDLSKLDSKLYTVDVKVTKGNESSEGTITVVEDEIAPEVNVLSRDISGIALTVTDNMMEMDGEDDEKGEEFFTLNVTSQTNGKPLSYTWNENGTVSIDGDLKVGDTVVGSAFDTHGNEKAFSFVVEGEVVKDPEVKDPENPIDDPKDPIVVPPVDGGNDDDPSCAIAGVGSKEKAPSKEKLTLASLLALAAFWRRREK